MDEKSNMDSLDIELNFDDLKPPAEEARQKMKDAQMAEFQERYVAEVGMYMEEGNMPRRVWDKLPRVLQTHYKKKFLGTPGHVEGIPMTQTQKDAAKRAKERKRASNKRAKQARKVTRRNSK